MAEVGPRLGDQQQADPSPPKGRGDLLLKSKLQMTENQAPTIHPHFHRQITPSWRSAKLAKLKVNTLNIPQPISQTKKPPPNLKYEEIKEVKKTWPVSAETVASAWLKKQWISNFNSPVPATIHGLRECLIVPLIFSHSNKTKKAKQ